MYSIHGFLGGFFILLLNYTVTANNSSYIALSGQIAKKMQLGVVANNVANANTNGFEQDEIIFQSIGIKKNKIQQESFVKATQNYRSDNVGKIKVTNRSTDVAIGNNGYFKILTPIGIRYTLDGAIFINNERFLVNHKGDFYLSSNNDVIEIPEDIIHIDIAEDGTIFANRQEVSVLGVFDFDKVNIISKEGDNIYNIRGEDKLLDDFIIIAGALRGSNVNPTLAMVKMIELQKSYGLITDLMNNSNELESLSIQKLTK